MISVDLGSTRFQLRAAAIIQQGDSVLLHRALRDEFWALPGGRVEAGEHASATIVREMKEELDEDVQCGELLYVVENFFEYSGTQYHEIGLFFLVHLLPASRLGTNISPFVITEGQTTFEFAWFDRSRLPEVDVRPAFLRQSLSRSSLVFEHVVQRDETERPFDVVPPAISQGY